MHRLVTAHRSWTRFYGRQTAIVKRKAVCREPVPDMQNHLEIILLVARTHLFYRCRRLCNIILTIGQQILQTRVTPIDVCLRSISTQFSLHFHVAKRYSTVSVAENI